MNHHPPQSRRSCQIPGPTPEPARTPGHGHRTGTASGYAACGHRAATCARRPRPVIRRTCQGKPRA
jgi:hypothetical protein